MLTLLDWPLTKNIFRFGVIIHRGSIQRVDMLQLGNVDEVFEQEELFHSLELDLTFLLIGLSSVLHVQNVENLGSYVSMSLVVIIIVEDIGKEGLCLHVIEEVVTVNIVLVEDDPDVLYAIVPAPLPAHLQALHILVEHVGCEQIGQEVKAHEHKEHEQQSMEEVNVHGGEEHIWEVGSCEQNCHVPVCIADCTKVLEALKRRSVEVVDGEYEEQDVSEDGQQDSKRVPQVTEEAVNTLAESVLESKQYNHAHQVGKVRVLHAEEAASEVDDRDKDCNEQDSCGFLLVLGLIAPAAFDEGHEDEGDHAHNIDQDGEQWRESWKG